MNKIELMNRISYLSKHFTRNPHSEIIKRATNLFMKDRCNECINELDKLPSEEDLMNDLVEKLRGKSVHKTLMKIQEGGVDANTKVKGLSSLITHIVIESVDRPEYKILLRKIVEKLNEVVYSI